MYKQVWKSKENIVNNAERGSKRSLGRQKTDKGGSKLRRTGDWQERRRRLLRRRKTSVQPSLRQAEKEKEQRT